MEKISGILPPSARTRAAEVAASQPARPGAPAHGRPMGRNSLGDRVTFSRELELMRQTGEMIEPEEPFVYKRSQENQKKKIIEDLNEKFFSPKSLARDEATTKSEETLKSTSSNEEQGFFVARAGAVQTPLKAVHEE